MMSSVLEMNPEFSTESVFFSVFETNPSFHSDTTFVQSMDVEDPVTSAFQTPVIIDTKPELSFSTEATDYSVYESQPDLPDNQDLFSSPCESNPCNNNGTCLNSLDLSDFTCDCSSLDYTGRLCEILDPCASEWNFQHCSFLCLY